VTSRFGDVVREYCPRVLLEIATQMVWYLEMWGTLLLFVPYRNAHFRVAMVALYVAITLGH
jgi:hypothetical protein